MRQSNIIHKNSQGTDKEFSRSNLYTNSGSQDPQTVGRKKRIGSKIKKAKQRRENIKNNSLAKISGNLPRDQELEHVLADDFLDSKNHIILDRQETGENLESSLDVLSRNIEEVEIRDYKKMKFENRNLKTALNKSQIKLQRYTEMLKRQEGEAHEMTKRFYEEQETSSKLADQLHSLNDYTKGIDKNQLKLLNNEKLKRARQENHQLKDENYSLEIENKNLRDSLQEYKDMDSYYLQEINKMESAIHRYQIKDTHLEKNKGTIDEMSEQIQAWEDKYQDIVNEANYKISDLEGQINQHKELIIRKDQDIEMLQKKLNDNAHLFSDDPNHIHPDYQQQIDEVQNLKGKLTEVTDELEEYRRFSQNNAMSSKIDIDKELQMRDQMHQNKLHSVHQQIDEWKNKCKDTEQRATSLQKQIRILEKNMESKENNNSTAIIDQSHTQELITQIRDLFDISEDAEVITELELIREEVETVELMKEELEKAQKVIKKLEVKHQKLLNKQSTSEMNDYSQELLNSKNEEIDRLNGELVTLNQKYDELENIRLEVNHEKHDLTCRVKDYERIIKDRELELNRLKKIKDELEDNNHELKETAKDVIRKNKDFERRLKDIESQDDLVKTKSAKDIENLRKESNNLISFILTLEFAKDEEFEKLFKNESYTSEFDQAKKHLENQKEITSSVLERSEKDIETKITEVENYKQYITELESKNEESEQLRSE